MRCTSLPSFGVGPINGAPWASRPAAESYDSGLMSALAVIWAR